MGADGVSLPDGMSTPDGTSKPADNASIDERVAAIAGAVFGKAVQTERVEHGVSTTVYRVRVAGELFYLRILPEHGASFEPEAEVHRLLRQLGANVPEILFVDPCDAVLDLSVMVVAEIPGQPIAEAAELAPQTLEAIAREAGRDLARVNSLPVQGFGWIERGVPGGGLSAQHASWRDVVSEYWDSDLAFLVANVISDAEARALEQLIVTYDAWLDPSQAWLAHGDLDATHIFQRHGQYTGLIDFGEIRGAGRWYDAGHFHLRDGERLPVLLEPALLGGYSELLALPLDIQQRVRFEALLINVRALARSLRKRPLDRWTRHQLEVLRADIAALF